MFKHDTSMHIDSIPAVLSCPTLLAQLRQIGSEDNDIKHDHICSKELTKQRAATVYFHGPPPGVGGAGVQTRTTGGHYKHRSYALHLHLFEQSDAFNVFTQVFLI